VIDVQTTELMIQTFSSMRAAPNAQEFQDHFWQLMDRFRSDLVHQALVMLGNQADAEDVAQETLCRAYLDIHKLQDPEKLGSWLRTINRCRALDILRKRKVQREERLGTGAQETLTKEQLPNRSATPRDGSHTDVRHERLLMAVDSLPEAFREIFLLHYLEKMTLEEISQRLGIPPGTARSRMARADSMLLIKLETRKRQERHMS